MNLNVITPHDAARMTAAIKESDKTATTIAEEATQAPTGETPQVSADDVYTTLLKIVPVPLLGFYLAFQTLWLSVAGDDTHEFLFITATSKQFATWATLIVFLVLVVLFLLQRKIKRGLQYIVTVVAFAVLATASQGPFQLASWWKEWIGTAALFGMGVVLIFYQPRDLSADDIAKMTP
ncbi:MAG TPA: hypothetical protein VFX51_13135 [Solirubrobacteraceae bacterium]|nr:hypothetical protein [Solirubrobacteraceae bacterium]